MVVAALFIQTFLYWFRKRSISMKQFLLLNSRRHPLRVVIIHKQGYNTVSELTVTWR